MSAVVVVQPCLDQRRRALIDANETRLRIAGFKRHIGALDRHSARKYAAAILISEPALVGEMLVHVFLGSIPGFGPERVRKILQRQRVWPLQPVSALTERQRVALAMAVRRGAA